MEYETILIQGCNDTGFNVYDITTMSGYMTDFIEPKIRELNSAGWYVSSWQVDRSNSASTYHTVTLTRKIRQEGIR
jgi:hypothetical protein